jgi:hypothetical protein
MDRAGRWAPAGQRVTVKPGSNSLSAPATVVRPVRSMSAFEYDLQLMSADLVGIALPADVRHRDGPPGGLAAIFGLFVVAQPQIERAASKAAHVRVVM